MIPFRIRIPAGREKLSRAIRVLKFTVFLITSICVKVNGEVHAQQVTLSLKNVPLSKVFKETVISNIDVTGTIKDENGEPVAGASILVIVKK